MLEFKSQLETETSLKFSVDDGSRKRAIITLTLSRTEAAEISPDCDAGQQVVDLSCGEEQLENYFIFIIWPFSW